MADADCGAGRAPRRRAVLRRRGARHRGPSRADARAPLGAGGRAGRGQDGDREGAGSPARPRADPPAVLRGARRRAVALRVGSPQAAAGDPRVRGRGPAGRRPLRHRVPDGAAAAAFPARAERAADRRDRPRGQRVRGVPARVPERLPDHDPRAGHGDRRRAPDRRHDLQPHPRAARRAQAPLPLSLDRLPERGARAADHRGQGAGAGLRRGGVAGRGRDRGALAGS